MPNEADATEEFVGPSGEQHTGGAVALELTAVLLLLVAGYWIRRGHGS